MFSTSHDTTVVDLLRLIWMFRRAVPPSPNYWYPPENGTKVSLP